MDRDLPVQSPPEPSYLFTGKIMLSAIFVLFFVVVFMVCLHLYARWHAVRRRQHRTTTVIYIDNHIPVADRGLEPSVLNSLPVFNYSVKAALPSVSAECAVCLSEFEVDEIVRLLPKCGHSFHVDCIGMWFHSHSTCPLCRSPVEAVVNPSQPSRTAEELNDEGIRGEPSSSSGTELCVTCQHEEGNSSNTTSLWGRRKVGGGGISGIRIDGPPLRRTAEWERELSQSSPGKRLLSLKRIFSMGRKTGAGSGGATPAGELDLEGGVCERAGLPTPTPTPTLTPSGLLP